MKNFRSYSIIILTAVLLISVKTNAQSPVNHRIGFYLQPEVWGVTAYKSHFSGIKFSPEIAVATGIFYQIEKKWFWFQAGIGYTSATGEFIYTESLAMVHSDDPVVQGLNELRYIISTAHILSMPLQFGGKFYNRPAFAMGAFVGMTLNMTLAYSSTYVYRSYPKKRVHHTQINFLDYSCLTAGLTFEYMPNEKWTLSAIPQIGIPFDELQIQHVPRRYTAFMVNLGLKLQVSFRI